MSTHVPGFQPFFRFFANYLPAALRVKPLFIARVLFLNFVSGISLSLAYKDKVDGICEWNTNLVKTIATSALHNLKLLVLT